MSSVKSDVQIAQEYFDGFVGTSEDLLSRTDISAGDRESSISAYGNLHDTYDAIVSICSLMSRDLSDDGTNILDAGIDFDNAGN